MRFRLVFPLALAGFALGAGSAEVEAAAQIQISVTATSEPTIWLEDQSFDVVVANPGTEPLSSVVVTSSVEGPPFPRTVLTDPVVVVGDDDDVLDPGEQWRYEAVIPVLEPIVVEATGFASDTSAASDVFIGSSPPYPGSLAFPVELSMMPDVATPAAGDSVRWTVSGSNIAAFPLVVTEAEWRLNGSGGFAPLGAPVDPGDGDEVLGPGEIWRWEATTAVMDDGAYLQVGLAIARADLEGRLGAYFTRDSAPLTVVAPPSTTQPPPTTVTQAPTLLPATGVDRAAPLAARCLVLLGTVALAVARR